jgi:predicted DNA-binding transcriptional regulator AlpA
MNTTKTLLDSERLALPARDAAALVGVSRAQWWKLHSAGKVPLPVYLGSKAPRWRVHELRAWLDAGCPDRLTWQRMREARP